MDYYLQRNYPNRFLTEKLVEQAQGINAPQLVADDSWHWCAAVTIGIDEAVIFIAQVKGQAEKMQMISHHLDVRPACASLDDMCDDIEGLYTEYPGIQIGVNCNGVGATLRRMLMERGLEVQPIEEAKPFLQKHNKARFINRRAYAQVHVSDAVREGRVKLLCDPEMEKQAVSIPWCFNDKGQYVCMNKKNISVCFDGLKTDRWDVHSYPWLMDFAPDEKD
jgi:hypothetical protein